MGKSSELISINSSCVFVNLRPVHGLTPSSDHVQQNKIKAQQSYAVQECDANEAP